MERLTPVEEKHRQLIKEGLVELGYDQALSWAKRIAKFLNEDERHWSAGLIEGGGVELDIGPTKESLRAELITLTITSQNVFLDEEERINRGPLRNCLRRDDKLILETEKGKITFVKDKKTKVITVETGD